MKNPADLTGRVFHSFQVLCKDLGTIIPILIGYIAGLLRSKGLL